MHRPLSFQENASANLSPEALGLRFLWLELTHKCNLACRHCYVSANSEQPLYDRMTARHWRSVLAQAGDLGCKQVQFIGGEPVLLPELDNLVGVARDHDYELIEVYTNATGITARRAAHFAENSVRVACSFYSADAATHDRITRKAGSHLQTMRSLDRLLGHGVPIRVGFIEMAENRGQFEDCKRALAALGISDVGRDMARSVGRGAGLQPDPSQDGFAGLCGQCWKGSLCVTPNGDAFPCVMARRHRVGNVLEQSLMDIVESCALRAFRVALAGTVAEQDGRNPPAGASTAGLTCMPRESGGPAHRASERRGSEPSGAMTCMPRESGSPAR
ncbi:MAG: radical SAM protein [Alphaproteobacteria bacterium]|nr:radical SAM protein [Alphaproteobacteria bacterium]